MMVRNVRMHWAVALLALLLAAGCRQPLPAASTATPAPVTPHAIQVVNQMEVDLDGDGTVEQVTVAQADGQLQLSIAALGGRGAPWNTPLPAGATLDNLSNKDVNADGRLEVLVETHEAASDEFELLVIACQAGQGQVLAPKGGPLDGKPHFQAKTYAPLVDDLDANSTWEIIVFLEGTNSHFLDSRVYEWDGTAYSATDLYMMPPRIVPTPTPS